MTEIPLNRDVSEPVRHYSGGIPTMKSLKSGGVENGLSFSHAGGLRSGMLR